MPRQKNAELLSDTTYQAVNAETLHRVETLHAEFFDKIKNFFLKKPLRTLFRTAKKKDS